jgi:3-hydroxyisobutyrate dehydrogenase
MSKPPVGFIGLGIMGRAMAGHILEAGFPLTIFNRTRSKTSDLASRGAVVAASPAEVAGRSEILVTMVTDTPDLEQVVAGPGGVLERVRPGSIVVDMSTVSPDLERRLDARLRASGGSLVDAPVSGGDVGARNATLAIMAGGDPGAVDRVRPLLATMGKTVTYCGPVGSGQIAKLSNQILVAVTLLGVSEAILFARRNGLDPGTMIEAVSGGAAGSWQLSNLGPKILAGDFAPGFMVDLIQKDLRLVLEAGAAANVPLSATALVHQLLRSVQARGQGRLGTQALARAVARLAGEE